MGVEIAINATKWNKRSTWKELAKKIKIKSWKQLLKGDT